MSLDGHDPGSLYLAPKGPEGQLSQIPYVVIQRGGRDTCIALYDSVKASRRRLLCDLPDNERPPLVIRIKRKDVAPEKFERHIAVRPENLPLGTELEVPLVYLFTRHDEPLLGPTSTRQCLADFVNPNTNLLNPSGTADRFKVKHIPPTHLMPALVVGVDRASHSVRVTVKHCRKSIAVPDHALDGVGGVAGHTLVRGTFVCVEVGHCFRIVALLFL